MLPSDVDQYRVIDTDTHVIEPYDLWTSRLSLAKWGDKVPHVKWDEKYQEDAATLGPGRYKIDLAALDAGTWKITLAVGSEGTGVYELDVAR